MAERCVREVWGRMDGHDIIGDWPVAVIGSGSDMIGNGFNSITAIDQGLIQCYGGRAVIGPTGNVSRRRGTCPGEQGSCHIGGKGDPGCCVIALRFKEWGI